MENHKSQIAIWKIGNTGLRNPARIHEGFKVFANSPFVGKLSKDNDVGFTRYLNDKGIIQNDPSKDPSGSHARKWRLMFEKNGLIYPKAKKGLCSQEELGDAYTITPFGKTFLKADTFTAIEECFLRALSVEQHQIHQGVGLFSPLRWILAIMLKLEEKTGSTEISRIEFALWGQTTDPSSDIDEVVRSILDLRKRRQKAPSKRKFDTQEREKRAKLYNKKSSNFLEYADLNMRYLRISGVLQRKGRGLAIVPSKHIIAEKLASQRASTEHLSEQIKLLTEGAPLPTDNLEIALSVLNELKRILIERHILFDLSDLHLDQAGTTTIAEVNIARRRLENVLAQTNEIVYAREQHNQWEEIADYMELLIEGKPQKKYDEDRVIEVPRGEAPVYLEWVMWRAALALNHLVNKPYEIRGFKLDSDFLPVSVAGGGRGDLYCEYEDYLILTEVTMSTSSRQEAMEGEPVRRHVADAIEQYSKPVYCIFVANKIDINTAETFRRGVWYTKHGEKRRLDIVPLTLEQFRKFFIQMFSSNQSTIEVVIKLLEDSLRYKDRLEASDWMEYITQVIESTIKSNFKEENGQDMELFSKLPLNMRFGSLLRDNSTGKIGTIVGRSLDNVFVVFDSDGNSKPDVAAIKKQNFKRCDRQKRFFSVAVCQS